MEIVDLDTDTPLRQIGIGLEAEEARELAAALMDLAENGGTLRRDHVAEEGFAREITVWVVPEA
jgi:hypothetical protein